MKVIQPGRPQQGWATEATCTGFGNGMGGCGAVLLVEQGDLYITVSSDYGGGRETFVTFACCECGVETDLKTVPSMIRSKLSEKPRRGRESDK